MIVLGVIWALIGYVICEVTHRGKVTTTVVTVVAGALGIGHGMATGHSGIPQLIIGAEITAAVALIILGITAGVLHSGRSGRHKHGSAAMASTRFVLHTERETEPSHRGKARPDRIRFARRGANDERGIRLQGR